MSRDTHDCPAAGCTRQVPDTMLMCGRHWGQVPAELRAAVYAAYRDRDVSSGGVAAHLQACENATAAVDGREPVQLFTEVPDATPSD